LPAPRNEARSPINEPMPAPTREIMIRFAIGARRDPYFLPEGGNESGERGRRSRS
jgi:hypothetical protein